MKKLIKNLFSIPRRLNNKINIIDSRVNKISRDIGNQTLLLGKELSNKSKKLGVLETIQDAEFKVFSQWGEDGIIQYLINKIDIQNKTFVEFGCGNYIESNTRFLLFNNNWSGLIMDGSKKYIDYIKNDENYWKYDITAKQAFISPQNINQLIGDAGFKEEIGLLSIDIDGNDYWVWEAINVINPAIVIIEYNSLFGYERAITIPYDENFDRMNAHYSGLYHGASLSALCHLGNKKGYSFIGTCSNGVNAFFIKNDKINTLKILNAAEGYSISKFRQNRDKHGNLTLTSDQQAFKKIKGLKVYNVISKTIEDL